MTPQIRRAVERGFTLIELLIVVAIISIIAAVAVPSLLRSKQTGSEVAAAASLQAISKAEVMYSLSCGAGGFAVSLPTLGTPSPGTSEGYLSADLIGGAVVAKSGYNVTLMAGAGAAAGPNDCNGVATQTTFYATAVPQSFGQTGSRSFAVNASGTVWMNNTAVAPTEPFGPPSVTYR